MRGQHSSIGHLAQCPGSRSPDGRVPTASHYTVVKVSSCPGPCLTTTSTHEGLSHVAEGRAESLGHKQPYTQPQALQTARSSAEARLLEEATWRAEGSANTSAPSAVARSHTHLFLPTPKGTVATLSCGQLGLVPSPSSQAYVPKAPRPPPEPRGSLWPGLAVQPDFVPHPPICLSPSCPQPLLPGDRSYTATGAASGQGRPRSHIWCRLSTRERTWERQHFSHFLLG